jgi:hypothetical protein
MVQLDDNGSIAPSCAGQNILASHWHSAVRSEAPLAWWESNRGVFTAIGNSMRRLFPKRVVAGIDVHFPVDFSPIPGVHYIRQSTSPEITRAIIRQMWMRLRFSQHGVLMLNGVLGAVIELAADVASISKTGHVILTGTPVSLLAKGFQRPGQQATLITASVDKSRPQQIVVGVSYAIIGS